jgi:hypothetical protein
MAPDWRARWRAARPALIGVAVAIGAAIASIVILAAWYRASDHTARLLEQRSPLVAVRTTEIPDSSGWRALRFDLTDRYGRVATGELRRPRSDGARLPAFLILGGHGTGGKAAGLIRLDKPAVICAIDYPEYPSWKGGLLRMPRTLAELDARVIEAVGMSFDALEYLVSRPDVDTSRVTVLGASFGAPFAVIVAALDRRAQALALLYGAGDLGDVLEWNLRAAIPSPILRKPAGWAIGTLTAPFEPLSYIARVSPRALLMVNGRDDEKIPARDAELLYRRAGEPKELVWIESRHVEPGERALIDSLTIIVSGWLGEHRLY